MNHLVDVVKDITDRAIRENVKLKESIAKLIHFSRLQIIIGHYNDFVTRCGCPRCTHEVGGNYLGFFEDSTRNVWPPSSFSFSLPQRPAVKWSPSQK